MSVRDYLEALYDSHGELTPQIVVDAAAPVDSPIHSRFEWDDGEAARLYRLDQAAALIRSVRVTREEQGEDDVPELLRVRVFHNVQSRGPAQYAPIRAMSDSEKRDVMAQAMAEWKQFKDKYKALKSVFVSIRRDLAA